MPPTRRFLFLFLTAVLLLHVHNTLPEWEELFVLKAAQRYIHRIYHKDHEHHMEYKAHPEPEGKTRQASDVEDIWDLVQPSQLLIWVPCYLNPTINFQCARLLVPLNYSAPLSPTNEASIALIRIPSPYFPTSKKYKGPILFNPGGPGGSGVDLILGLGGALRNVLGNGFDIVGFDPRGVSRSRPFVSVFRTPFDRVSYVSRQSVYGVVNTSTNSIAEQVAGAHVVSQLAEMAGGGYLPFINTDHTARDMLSIVRAHGRKKLQYWGFSYGTVLGATFASMFPDNVGRMIIDGVVDIEDYYSTSWTTNLLDTDSALQSFFSSCHAAGPTHCAFYAPSPSHISQNLTKIYDRLKARPIPFVSAQSGLYGVVDYNVLREQIFVSLYKPYATFGTLAEILAGLSEGIVPLAWSGNGNEDGKNVRDAMTAANRVGEAQNAILCNDGKLIPGTIEDTQAHFEDLLKLSEWADVWSRIRTMCSGWPAMPKFFQGPFTANTSFPILLIGNKADPVTPLAAAKKMSKAFPGSVVLTQDSPGHCSIAGPSVCTMKYVRAYFEDGTLPKDGTVCPVLSPPIPGPDDFRDIPEGRTSNGQVIFDGWNEEDRALADTVMKMSQIDALPRFF